MVVDFAQFIRGIDEKPIPNPNKDKTFLTLREVCINSLLSRFTDEAGISGEEMVERFELALMVRDCTGEQSANGKTTGFDIKPEQLVLIRRLIAKAHGPLVCGRAWKLLEGSNAPSE